ncbi:MAG: glycosyltransferase, partial [Deltaproteobacteria bacterium]|nr:glycosyltransferase [Deltaproteobacteria bacterium]
MNNAISNSISKILLIAPHFPPTIGGSQTLLRNLFRHFPQGSYATVTQKIGIADANAKMNCQHYYVPTNALLQRIRRYAEVILIPLSEGIIHNAARREKAQMIFLNMPDGHFMIAGWLAAQRLSIPYCVYLHDLWVENQRYLNKVIATRLELRILSGATILFTLTEAMRDYYLEKYQLESKVLPHGIDLDNAKAIPPRSRPPWKHDKPFRIVTSGAFYGQMNLDALRSLRKVFYYHPDEYIELHIITPYSNKSFKDEFTERRISVKYCT